MGERYQELLRDTRYAQYLEDYGAHKLSPEAQEALEKILNSTQITLPGSAYQELARVIADELPKGTSIGGLVSDLKAVRDASWFSDAGTNPIVWEHWGERDFF